MAVLSWQGAAATAGIIRRDEVFTSLEKDRRCSGASECTNHAPPAPPRGPREKTLAEAGEGTKQSAGTPAHSGLEF